jgi:hypothetical protein
MKIKNQSSSKRCCGCRTNCIDAAITSHPICCWLYGKQLGIREPAGCIGLQNWEFLSGIGRGPTACTKDFRISAAALPKVLKNSKLFLGSSPSRKTILNSAIVHWPQRCRTLGFRPSDPRKEVRVSHQPLPEIEPDWLLLFSKRLC